MPFGLTWPRYAAFMLASLASMLAGASAVHNYYKPSLVIPISTAKAREHEEAWK
eukprot:m.14795 g.14795  ORF g.14795 m.14795 type:complete len:54 (+) comp25983_c0_seq1:746-907(+)